MGSGIRDPLRVVKGCTSLHALCIGGREGSAEAEGKAEAAGEAEAEAEEKVGTWPTSGRPEAS
jgi:hypothetical protein